MRQVIHWVTAELMKHVSCKGTQLLQTQHSGAVQIECTVSCYPWCKLPLKATGMVPAYGRAECALRVLRIQGSHWYDTLPREEEGLVARALP